MFYELIKIFSALRFFALCKIFSGTYSLLMDRLYKTTTKAAYILLKRIYWLLATVLQISGVHSYSLNEILKLPSVKC